MGILPKRARNSKRANRVLNTGPNQGLQQRKSEESGPMKFFWKGRKGW